MAASAAGADLAGMDVGVTGRALGDQSEQRLFEVPALQEGTFRGGDELRLMAALATQACVFALEHIAGFAMVELLFVRLPGDDIEVSSEVLRVALRASQLALAPFHHPGVISEVLFHLFPDLLVARIALHLGFAGSEAVTADALQEAVNGFVDLGKPARGDLRRHDPRNSNRQQEHPEMPSAGGPDCPAGRGRHLRCFASRTETRQRVITPKR